MCAVMRGDLCVLRNELSFFRERKGVEGEVAFSPEVEEPEVLGLPRTTDAFTSKLSPWYPLLVLPMLGRRLPLE